MTAQDILGLVQSIFTGYANYEAGKPATLAPQEVDFAGARARLGLTVQKAGTPGAPTDTLQFGSPAELIADLETAMQDYGEWEAGDLITIPPVEVPIGADKALFSVTLQQILPNAPATGNVAPPASQAAALRASIGNTTR